MQNFTKLISIDKTSDTPVYLQLTNAIIYHIRNGRLRQGLKLPGTRKLATALGIHRKTLQTAFDELMAQGWVEILPRKGAFIVRELPEIKPIKIISAEKSGQIFQYPEKTGFSVEDGRVPFPVFSGPRVGNLILDDGFPDVRLAPTELLMREFRSIAKLGSFKKYHRYGDPRGVGSLLEALSVFLNDTRGLPISEKNIIVTRGAQMGLCLAAGLLIRPGDHVIVGEPGYFAATLTFERAGARINRVPVDETGIDVDKIERLCAKKKIKMVYVIPHHHHPTTVALSPQRRIRLLELAARYKFAIVEDDYDYDFHYSSRPIHPIASLDHHGNVIYIGTLSKTFAPSIRLGFMVAPENFIQAAANLRRSIDWQGDSMMEAAFAELYKNGTVGRHIKKVVKLYRERRDHFCEHLKTKLGDKISFKVPDGGMSVWAKFETGDLRQIAERASARGLTMSDGRFYEVKNMTRLGFASLNPAEQDRAIEILMNSM